MEFKKIIIISVIAVLYAVFVFSIIDAAYPKPDYSDYCKNNYISKPMMPSERIVNCTVVDVPLAEQDACYAQDGMIEYNYDEYGCASTYQCNTCNAEFTQGMDTHNIYVFYISAFLSLIAIFVGMYLPTKENTLNEWIGIGFMLGGAFALFFGTATSYGSLDRLIRPIVIFLELVLVIFISYKKTKSLTTTQVKGRKSK